ncbi:MAG: hypothetical protein RIR39_545 [Pseudomonadota bacterium]|jgi:hypothetical protein
MSLKEHSISNGCEPDKRLNLIHDRRMNLIMNINDLKTIEQLEHFLTGIQSIAFLAVSNKQEQNNASG